MFSHITTSDLFIEKKLHISHLMQYLSAYEPTKEMKDQLVEDIEKALIKAKKTKEVQIINQDGECYLHVSSNGYLTLMFPIRQYQIIREENNIKE